MIKKNSLLLAVGFTVPAISYARTDAIEKDYHRKQWSALKVWQLNKPENYYQFRAVTQSQKDNGVLYVGFDETSCQVSQIGVVLSGEKRLKKSSTQNANAHFRVDKKDTYNEKGVRTQVAFDGDVVFVFTVDEKTAKPLMSDIASGKYIRVKLTEGSKKNPSEQYLKFSLSGSRASINRAMSWCASNPKYQKVKISNYFKESGKKPKEEKNRAEGEIKEYFSEEK
jgi:hypothetical protein